MEIPRHWRVRETREGFRTTVNNGKDGTPQILRFPGGEVNLSGSLDEIYTKLEDRGFNKESIETLLAGLFGAVAAESAVSTHEIIEGFLELFRGEVGEKGVSEVELGVNRLPG